MALNNSLSLKSAVLTFAREQVNQRLAGIRHEIADIQNSANEETKSVAGDKYETSRAMAHLEIEKLQERLNDLGKSVDILNQIQVGHIHENIQLGSIVRTTNGNFFLSAGVGEIQIDDQKFITISLASPLGSKLLGKRKGDSVEINTRKFLVTEIF